MIHQTVYLFSKLNQTTRPHSYTFDHTSHFKFYSNDKIVLYLLNIPTVVTFDPSRIPIQFPIQSRPSNQIVLNKLHKSLYHAHQIAQPLSSSNGKSQHQFSHSCVCLPTSKRSRYSSPPKYILTIQYSNTWPACVYERSSYKTKRNKNSTNQFNIIRSYLYLFTVHEKTH